MDQLVVGVMARMMMSLKLWMSRMLCQVWRGSELKGEPLSTRIETDRHHREVERVVVQWLKEEVPRDHGRCHTLTVGEEGNKSLKLFKGENTD